MRNNRKTVHLYIYVCAFSFFVKITEDIICCIILQSSDKIKFVIKI